MFDIFIKRPVLASVISLLILAVGLRALFLLPVREYPDMDNTVITITTMYPGADAELIQGFITQPIQKSIATAKGLDYITARSLSSMSEVKAYVRLNEDPDAAMTEVMSKVNEVRSVLPSGIDDPIIKKETGQTFPSAFLSFSSDRLNQQQMTDYVTRVVQPKLSSVPGVANPQIFGEQKFAMRVWVDPLKLAQLGLGADDLRAALSRNNFTSAAGSTEGVFDVITNKAETDLTNVDEFRQLVIRNVGDRLVRLGDVAQVELGAQNDDTSVFVGGDRAIFVGIFTTPEANPLTVIKDVRENALPSIAAQLPSGMEVKVAYDSTIFIESAINEVAKTILEASIIVMVVIFLFMGNLRSVAIPVVTVPLSLVGVGIFLMALGFSINLLTLLAMVLAIGLVVDDAIVVVENVHRHIEEGYSPFDAAILGTREIAGPVISMTITLAAVYTPIAFMGGLTGALFKEFALTLAGSVIISGVIALTLSPMMSSKLLRHTPADDKSFARKVDAAFDRVRTKYDSWLAASLADRGTTIVFAIIVMISLPLLYLSIPNELAPEEDQGVVLTAFNGPASANIDFMEVFALEMNDKLKDLPEAFDIFLIAGMGSPSSGFGGVVMNDWAERDRTTKELTPVIQKSLDSVTGVKASAFVPPALPGVDGLPVQFVINSTNDHRQLEEVTQELMARANKSGRFAFIDTDLKFESPQTRIVIDRQKAAAYGITMEQIGMALATMTGGNYVNLINLDGRSYQVIPEVPREFRMNPEQLASYYINTPNGRSVPLGSLVSFDKKVLPVSLNQFNQLNSVTISAFPMPGSTLGDALSYLEEQAKQILPQGYAYDYSGQSRQYVQEGAALAVTFIFALIIIYLVLAAQFESLRDPVVILVSVPLSICGALIPLALGVATMNIYSQVGLITLIGLITKHGILICEVAKETQENQGLSRLEAVKVAAGLRLRPILMTTAAMVAGLVPLIFATGAGAASRHSIAWVIIAGMTIGTLFTLFVLPVIYTFIATDRQNAKAPETQLAH